MTVFLTLPEDSFFCSYVGLELCCPDVDADRLWQMTHRLGYHGFSCVTRLESGCLQPHILTLVSRKKCQSSTLVVLYNDPSLNYLRAHLCAFHDQVPGYLKFASHLLQPGRRNPGRRVMGIGFPHRFQKQAGLLDVTRNTELPT